MTAIALSSVAQTKTYDVTGQWNSLDGYASHAGMGDICVTKLNYPSSASQLLLTSAELSGIMPKGDASGVTKARIKSITFKINCEGGAYIAGGTVDITSYAQNVSETEYPKKDNQAQYFEYTTDAKATFSIDAADDEDFAAIASDGGQWDVTLTFEGDGLVYEGESLLLTTFSNSDLENYMDQDWWHGVYSKSTTNVRSCGLYGSNITTLSGKISNETKAIPHMLIAYEEVTESTGPTVSEGTPVSGYKIGTQNEGRASAGQFLPINPDYDSSVSQTIYTMGELPGLYNVDGQSTTKASISAITTYMTVFSR